MGAAPRRAQQATDTGRGLAVQGISYAKLANLPPILGLCKQLLPFLALSY